MEQYAMLVRQMATAVQRITHNNIQNRRKREIISANAGQ
jgi:hypothetical protein